jgi:hypothetical protein
VLDQTAHYPVPTVYAAIELSKKSWIVAIVQPAKGQPSIYRIKGGAFSELVMRLRTATPSGERLLVCYEAGYDGFWLARSLQTEKIDCRVLDPASLQVNRRARRVKTDRIDVLMLLRALIAVDRGDRHVCSIVRVPTIEEEDARRSHRERQRLIRERTAHINRIKGLLFGQGIRGVEPRPARASSCADGSAPHISTASKGCCSDKAFAASSRDCDVRALIFLTCAPARDCRFRLGCAPNPSVNMPVSTSSKHNCA